MTSPTPGMSDKENINNVVEIHLSQVLCTVPTDSVFLTLKNTKKVEYAFLFHNMAIKIRSEHT